MLRRAAILLFAAALAAACRPAGPAGLVATTRAAGHDIELRLETRTIAARVASGMTLASLLTAHHIAANEAASLVAAVKAVFDPRKVRVAQPYRLAQAFDGAIRSFEYEIDGDRVLRVDRPALDAALEAHVVPIPKTSATAILRGLIGRTTPSLFAAIESAGGTIDLALALAEVFAGEVDFNTELQPGDRFTVLVDKQFREGDAFAGYGPIRAAELDNDGRHFRAVRYAADGASPAYFDDKGVSMRRFLLHSPLKFEPIITSRFTRSRLHPVLREYRAHLGVDYQAPLGAPVVAVAEGVVLRAGTSGDAGRMVHLRHSNGLESEYLHLSEIAVRAGMRVHQGDLIGRVGATGLATGPHLDYRVRKNGAFINPLTASREMPPADPVPPGEMTKFAAVRDRALGEMAVQSLTSPGDSGSP